MRISDWSSDVCSSDLFDQLVELRALFSFVPRGDRFCDAGSGVIFQHFALDPGKAGFNGLQLRQNVDAVAAVLAHFRDATDLPGHAVDPVHLPLDGFVAIPHFFPVHTLWWFMFSVHETESNAKPAY